MYDNQLKNFALIDTNGVVVEIKTFSLDSTDSYLGDSSYYAVCIDNLDYTVSSGMIWNYETYTFQ